MNSTLHDKRGRITNYCLIIVTFVLAYFPIFYKLDSYGLYIWDEARNAVCAYEMFHNGDYIVRHFDGNMDNWELKPPMLIWLQILFAKVLGFNELSIRLPSALAALACLILIIGYSKKIFGTYLIGIISSFVLITSTGYIGEHVVRTGDHDSLLVFFLLFQTLLFYTYLIDPINSSKSLLMIGVLTICAVLTKSIIGLLLLPGVILFTTISGNFKNLITNKYSYIALVMFLIVVCTYYIMREVRQSGYMGVVWDNELFPRYKNDNKIFKDASWTYYLEGFLNTRFRYWVFLLIPCMFCTYVFGDTRLIKFLNYLLCISVPFFLIISFGSKNFWYDAPLYPYMAFIIGLGFYTSINKLKKYTFSLHLIPYLIFIPIFICNYSYTLSSNHKLRNTNYGVQLYSEFTNTVFKANNEISPVKTYHYKYDASKAQLLFHAYTQPNKCNYISDTALLKVEDSLIICDKYSGELLLKNYYFDTILQYKACVYVKLLPK